MKTQKPLDDASLVPYLAELGLFSLDARLEIVPAGDGNINWVRRVRVGDGARSFVVKQARPALERFPEYRVPTERIVCEARYYEAVRPLEVRPVCPAVLHFDAGQRVLVLEDLGTGPRLDELLADGASLAEVFAALGAFLASVHAGIRDPALAGRFANEAMRRLHGDHIFALPLRPNDFPLPPLLRRRAESLWQDAELRARADAAHASYLGPGRVLVHADVQPANVLLHEGRPRLLDAEIAHLGDPAFDLGTLLAHAWLAARARGRPGEAALPVAAAWDAYRAGGGPDLAFEDVARYGGLEMLRRTIGAARVPLVQDENAALAVLDAAVRLVRAPPSHPSTA